MKHPMKYFMIALMITLMTVACSKDEPVASFEQLEDAREVVEANASMNARAWLKDAILPIPVERAGIKMRSDSTQNAKCLPGDGWVSVDIIDKETVRVTAKLKCSSVSMRLGCIEESDFKTKSYATEDGVCNLALPNPPVRFVK